jgi:hypothetical protein
VLRFERIASFNNLALHSFKLISGSKFVLLYQPFFIIRRHLILDKPFVIVLILLCQILFYELVKSLTDSFVRLP